MKKSFGWIHPIKVKVEDGMVTVKRSSRKVKTQRGMIRGVRVERRFFRGHVLVVETTAKTMYFRQSKRACEGAMKLLMKVA